MPRFAANLAYLFTERGMIERFAAAAAAGFAAVELQLPYDHAPSAVKAELDRHGLTVLGINTGPGQLAGGEFGVGAIPGREQEFAKLFAQSLDYVTAIGGCQIHCLAGKVPPEHRPAAERTPVAAAGMLEPEWTRLCDGDAGLAELFAEEAEREQFIADAHAALAGYFRLEDPRRLEPAEREWYVEAELPSGLRLRGYVDRLDVSPAGDIRVVDYKTGKVPLEAYEASALEGDPGLARMIESHAPLGRIALAIDRRATDRDGDGASPYFGGGDCDDRTSTGSRLR